MTKWTILNRLPNDRAGVMLALIATLCYSLKPIFIKLIYQHDVTSLNVLVWRMIISLPIYLGIGYYLWRRAKKCDVQKQRISSDKSWVWKTILIGVMGYYFAALFDLLGLQYITSQFARLILFTYPTLVALLGWLFFRQKLSRSVLYALIFSYVGLSFIFVSDFNSFGDKVVYGSFLMFLSVLFFSLYVLLSKKLIDQVGGSTFTVVAMIASSFCIAIHLLIASDSLSEIELSLVQFSLVGMMTILTTVIPSFLIAEAIALIGPQKSSIAGTFGPVATSIFAVFMLGETFGFYHLIGLILVVLAIYIMQKDSLSEKTTT
jgi:drug/metabolite transporter (DMT)-like permease